MWRDGLVVAGLVCGALGVSGVALVFYLDALEQTRRAEKDGAR